MFAFQGAEIVLPVPHPCTNSFRGCFDVRPSRCKFEAIARATAGLAAPKQRSEIARGAEGLHQCGSCRRERRSGSGEDANGGARDLLSGADALQDRFAHRPFQHLAQDQCENVAMGDQC